MSEIVFAQAWCQHCSWADDTLDAKYKGASHRDKTKHTVRVEETQQFIYTHEARPR